MKCALLVVDRHDVLEPAGVDWEYFRASPTRTIHLRDFGDNQYEIIVPVSEP